MNRRQAKKVIRNEIYSTRIRYRTVTVIRASNVNWRSRRGRSYEAGTRTPGWRWGRWDPHLPTPPWEIPF
jgi:hypothetical protein